VVFPAFAIDWFFLKDWFDGGFFSQRKVIDRPAVGRDRMAALSLIGYPGGAAPSGRSQNPQPPFRGRAYA